MVKRIVPMDQMKIRVITIMILTELLLAIQPSASCPTVSVQKTVPEFLMTFHQKKFLR